MLANALAASGSLELPTRVLMGFVDEMVDRLIGIDGEQEKSLCLLPVGRDSESQLEFTGEETFTNKLPTLDLDIMPISPAQVEYPIIQSLHKSSNLSDIAEVKSWKQPYSFSWNGENGIQLAPLEGKNGNQRALEEVIVKRGSSRRFTRDAISFNELSSILAFSSQSLPADWLAPGKGLLNRIYLSVHAVDELDPGAYVLQSIQNTLHLLNKGNFRGDSATICLGQDLGGDSSAAVYFIADLNAVLNHFGNRGYRVVQLEAGIIGGLLYLGAYGQNRGASGLTFFDDMMVDFFKPHADGLDAIFVVVLGVPDKRGGMGGRIRRVLPGEKIPL
jgi:hypothetical protein